MVKNIFVLFTLVAVGLAQDQGSLPDLPTLLNQTDGFYYLSQQLRQYPSLIESFSTLENVTVLAPSNAALALFPWDPRYKDVEHGGAAYLQALIGYHVLEGIHDNFTRQNLPYKTFLRLPEFSNVTGGQVVLGRYNANGFETSFLGGRHLVANAPVTLRFNGGIVYPIDDLLNIPRKLSTELTSDSDVVNGTAFIRAVERAGLLTEFETLKDATFIVPTDDAFKTVEDSIAALSKEKLVEVLKYHVILDGPVYSALAKNNTTYRTLQGQGLKLTQPYGSFLGNALVRDTDLLTSNGVVHTVDQVLNPEWTPQEFTVDQRAGVPAFPTGSSTESPQAGVTTASAAAATYTGSASSIKTGAISAIAFAAAIAFAVNQ